MGLVLALTMVGVWLFNTYTEPSVDPVWAMGGWPGESAPGAVRVRFTGTSTLLFHDGETAWMVDGWFSRPGPLRLLLGGIEPDIRAIHIGLERNQVRELAAVIPVHSHYDHAMDSPEVARRTGALLVGSETTAQIGRGWGLDESRIRVVRDGETLRFGSFAITFLATRHFQFPDPRVRERALGNPDLDAPLVPPVGAFDYPVGVPFALHVEHPRGSFLVQGSAGFIEGAFEGLAVDTVFLGVGGLGTQTPEYREAYWRETVERVAPRRVIPIHWDSLTGPIDGPFRGPVRVMAFLSSGGKDTLAFLRGKARAQPELEFWTLPRYDEVLLFPVTAMPSLPQHPEAIDCDWLSAALGARARRVEVLDANSGTTGRAMLRVEWEAGASLPRRVFAKLPPTDPTQRQMSAETDMGRREARFYADLAPEVPVRVPAPLWSGFGEDPLDYLMLLEDLADSGCHFPHGGEPNHADYLRTLMRELARLHARYWNWSEHAAAHPWVDAYSRSEWGLILVKAALEQFRDSQPPEFAAIAELYIERRDDFNDFLDAGPHTLVHGDCHLGNLFADGPRPGFLDWACTAHAPGMRDVAYHLCNSVPTELRRREERDLLHRYRAGLEAASVPQPDFDETWRDYRRMALSSWIAAVTTAAAGSRMQSLEVGLRAMQRSGDAVRDLDSLGLLREALG